MKQQCLWCGKTEADAVQLFRGPAVCVCNRCVEKMSGSMKEEDVTVAEQVKKEVDKAVQDSFRDMITNLNLGPLQDKYQRLMKVKFKEEEGGATFQEVFGEFKRGVEAEIAADDYQTRYDLGIAYYEMGLIEDAFREMASALGGALRQKDFNRAAEVMSALFFFHGDNEHVIKAVFRLMCEAGVE
jgi:hypothetical protein